MRTDELAVVHRRLRAQRLAAAPLASPAEAVAWLGAMQAQEFAEAKWSVAERVPGCTDADVEAAFARGEILRTHVLRPTWHFVAPADIRWLLALTAPRVHALNRYMYRQTELDEATLARGCDVFAEALADGEPRTRPELAAALARAGIAAERFRLAYLLMNAELEAVICSGPRRGRQHTYALLSQRAPAVPELPREQALAELTRRFFRSRGPATVRDFTAWSSLTVSDARAGLVHVGDELERSERDGTTWYADPDPPAGDASGAFLIPMYDELTIGYRDLRVVLAAPAEGRLERPVVIDGRTVGSWKRTLGRARRGAGRHAVRAARRRAVRGARRGRRALRPLPRAAGDAADLTALADVHEVAVGIEHARHPLPPRLVGGLVDHLHAGRTQPVDRSVAILGVDPQAEAGARPCGRRRIAADPEVRSRPARGRRTPARRPGR